MRGIDRKRAMTAATTLCIAAAAGFFMQRGAPQSGAVTPTPQPAPAPALELSNLEPATEQTSAEVTRQASNPIITPPAAAAVVPDIEPTIQMAAQNMEPDIEPAASDIEPVELAALQENIPDLPELDALTPGPADETLACEVGFTLTAAPAAMMTATLEAPCHAGEVVEFFHAGMRFSEEMDDYGLVQAHIPALEEDATVAASFPDGETVGADLMMPTLSGYERVVLTWQGDTGLGLHALEAGATYGAPGHIHARATGQPERASAGEGGFLTVLGTVDDGWAADVYTYPVSGLGSGADPAVSIEAEVMDATCDAAVHGTYLRVNPTGQPAQTDLNFGAASCDAVGEFLVLKNLPQDLKIARN